MKIVNEDFEFPNLNSAKYPNLKTSSYTLVYHIPVKMFKKLKGMDNFLVWTFINQTANFLTNVLNIDSSWRKLACAETGMDKHRLSKSLIHLQEIEFIVIVDNKCRLNPFISSKGPSYKRNSIINGMEGSKAPSLDEMF